MNSWPITLFLFYSSIPLLVYLNGNFNYYWDALSSVFIEDESAAVYDFIVGKHRKKLSVNGFEEAIIINVLRV